jgi:ribosome maturation protein SDO1
MNLHLDMFLPSNQVKLTNVSVVRLKKGGKRFEVACYKNKVLEWRSGVEKDLDNVLQTESIFINVSKGQLAKQDDLLNAFKTSDESLILQEILKNGQLQVGEKERDAVLSNLTRDIATIVSEKCINPSTKRPWPVSTIEQVMSEIHFSVSSKNAKSQALELIKSLQEKQIIPIARAQMRIKISCMQNVGKKVKEKCLHLLQIESEDYGMDYELIGMIDPGAFRTIGDILQEETKGKGGLEVLDVKESVQGDMVL